MVRKSAQQQEFNSVRISDHVKVSVSSFKSSLWYHIQRKDKSISLDHSELSALFQNKKELAQLGMEVLSKIKSGSDNIACEDDIDSSESDSEQDSKSTLLKKNGAKSKKSKKFCDEEKFFI